MNNIAAQVLISQVGFWCKSLLIAYCTAVFIRGPWQRCGLAKLGFTKIRLYINRMNATSLQKVASKLWWMSSRKILPTARHWVAIFSTHEEQVVRKIPTKASDESLQSSTQHGQPAPYGDRKHGQNNARPLILFWRTGRQCGLLCSTCP